MKQFISAVFLIVISMPLWADDARSFEAEFHAIQTMYAGFKQVVLSKGQAKNTSSGTMALNRPGQFRWETKEPVAQVVVADGSRLWVYDVLLEQVTVRKQREISDHSAGLFLSSRAGQIEEAYRVVATPKNNSVQYDLFAKSSSTDFKHAIFLFRAHQLVQLELFDALGQRTQITFHHIETNKPLKSSLFHFKPPKGVDIIDEVGETGAS